MKHVIRFPLSAAALAVLLAACGGGGGSTEKTVSSSPTAPGGTSSANAGAAAGAAATSTTNVTIGAADTPTAPGNAGTGAGSNTGTPNSPATPAPGSTGNGGGSANPPATSPTNPAPDGPSPTPPASGNSDNPAPATPGTPAAPGTPSADAGSPQPNPTQPSTPPAAPSSPAQPVPLVSASGVRGDVLLGMLSQKPCIGSWPTPVKGDDGSFFSKDMLEIVADSHMGNYVVWHDARTTGYFNTLGCAQQDYYPVFPGARTYHHSHIVYAKFYRTPRVFVSLRVSLPAHVGTEEVTLYRHMDIDGVGIVLEGSAPPGFSRQLQAATDYTFRLDANIPFGDIHQWTAPNPQDADKPQFDKLMLLKGSGPRDVRLCWNTDLVEVKRLQCMDWRIQEDWKAGTELVNLGQTLIEDRSVYPDETGFAHWRGTDQ